ncbi:DUF1853 family protein [Microbulbifer celer]|uniref:DUF1853 family protein n=1 Tax=Microbulbifer celer TaxID=435905 RepID=A0ABW3U4N0_9GAMM|nr:DUF1853 family protein [Microbulbifer celer]UFN57651.1 DUF1853 family protein [Microbulbifer celer]
MTDRRLSSAPLPKAIPDHWQNLLWSLVSPDISADTRLPWLPASRRKHLGDFFQQPRTRATLEPELVARLEQKRSHRLGIYFENLWAFAFHHHPDYRLLARNLPIRNAGKTLGELDFVVEYLPDNVTEHWELAVKFYLQVGDCWVGPGQRDRLDIKLARMADHQIPIARCAEAESTLAAQNVQLDRQWTLMPGRLFTPLDSTTPSEPGFWWADCTQFQRHFSASPLSLLHLPKQAWLASCDLAYPSRTLPVPLPIHQFNPETLRSSLDGRGPLYIAVTGDTGEVSRGFLVPDHWLQSATITLPPE